MGAATGLEAMGIDTTDRIKLGFEHFTQRGWANSWRQTRAGKSEGQLAWAANGNNGSDEYIGEPCRQLLSQGSVSALEAGV